MFAAKRDGLELIGVVLNCPDWFREAEALLDKGFDSWQMVSLLSAGETVRTVPVKNGVSNAVRVIASSDVAGPVRLDAWPDLVLELPDSLEAGFSRGQTVGVAKLMDAGQTLITVPLVTAEAVPERSFRHGWQSVLREWPLAAGE